MYLGKRKIFNIESHEKHREECIKYRLGAIFTAFSELEELISVKELSSQYFGESPSWMTDKIDASMVIDKSKAFSVEESKQLSDAFRDIAKRLNAHADEIDRAKDYEE